MSVRAGQAPVARRAFACRLVLWSDCFTLQMRSRTCLNTETEKAAGSGVCEVDTSTRESVKQKIVHLNMLNYKYYGVIDLNT